MMILGPAPSTQQPSQRPRSTRLAGGVIRELHRWGYDGFILDDHTPAMVGDSSYGHRGRAFALGYIQGLIEMLEYDEVGVRRA